jgi:hypothetical protein
MTSMLFPRAPGRLDAYVPETGDSGDEPVVETETSSRSSVEFERQAESSPAVMKW